MNGATFEVIKKPTLLITDAFNIAQQSKYNLLTGMEKVSVNDSIKFIRPMLDISKSEIYDYAHKNSIPYLPNSTPSWSMRGQIRDKVRPVLLEWHTNIFRSLESLATVVKDMHELLEIQIENSIAETEKIIDQNYYVWNVATNLLPSKYIFWQNYTLKLLDEKISQKSSIYLQEKIEKYKIDKILMKMPLSKNIFIYIEPESAYCIDKTKVSIMVGKIC